MTAQSCKAGAQAFAAQKVGDKRAATFLNKKLKTNVAGEKNKNQLSVLPWNRACATGDAEVRERAVHARILTSAAFEFSGYLHFLSIASLLSSSKPLLLNFEEVFRLQIPSCMFEHEVKKSTAGTRSFRILWKSRVQKVFADLPPHSRH